MLLFSLAMAGAFIAIEARAKSPLVPLSLHADPVVGLSVVIMLLASFGLYGSVLFLPLFLPGRIRVLGGTERRSAHPRCCWEWWSAGSWRDKSFSRVSASYRIQATVFAGLMTTGLFLLSTMDATTGVARSQAYIVIAGLGVGGIVATLSIGVQNHVPFGIVGVATSALQFWRSVGGVMGLAVLGVVLATRFASSLEEAIPEPVRDVLASGRFEELQSDPRALVDSAAADGLRADLAAAGPDGATVAQELLDALGVALQEALASVFVVAAIAAALSVGFALFFRVTVRSEPAAGDAKPHARRETRSSR